MLDPPAEGWKVPNRGEQIYLQVSDPSVVDVFDDGVELLHAIICSTRTEDVEKLQNPRSVVPTKLRPTEESVLENLFQKCKTKSAQ